MSQYISYSSRNSGGGGGGSGTVTSVGLSLPSFITVSGSPVTTSGTLTGTLASQSQNLVFASPDGSSGLPTFRSLVSGDIPSLSSVYANISLSNLGTTAITTDLNLNSGNIFVNNGIGSFSITASDAAVNNPAQAIGNFTFTVDPTPNTSNYTQSISSNVLLTGGFSTAGPYIYTGLINGASIQDDGSNFVFDTFVAESINQELQAPTTTFQNVTGKYINIDMQGGMVNEYYGLRINDANSSPPSGTNSIQNYYGVFSEASLFATKNNWLAGKSLLGFSSFISPTATLHLPGGTTAAGSSPIKVVSGTLMTATEAGAIESDGTHLYWTNNSTTRLQLDNTSASGTVTSVSVVSANGLAGTVATATSTPAITLSTTITGLLKGNGTAISAAVSGTDYQPAGNYITALTTDVTATGPGSVAATIAIGAVTDTKGSLATKPACTVVATTNQALTGTPTIDGQVTAAGSVILLTAQSTGSQNGPWMAAVGAWTRPTWYPSGGTTQAFQFITTLVRLGTTYQGTTWRQTAVAPITIDTTATTWVVTPLALNSSTITGTVPAANLPSSFSGLANPTASLGLAAINGSATTAMRSDGAPALDVTIAPTWTGIHTWSNTEPRLKLNQSGAGSDLKLWDFDIASGVLTGRTRTDADGAGQNWLAVTRGATTAISSVTLGNATNNPTYAFLGSGSVTVNGGLSVGLTGTFNASLVAGRLTLTSATVPVNGLYLSTTNTLGFSTNTVSRMNLSTTDLTTSVDVKLGTAGNGLYVKEGSNATMGTATLVGGTATVSTTKVTANSRIFLTAQSLGTVAVPSGYGVSARVAATSFTILASAPTDTSIIAWVILEPA